MSIRLWFGCNVKYNQSSSVAKALDELLVLFSQAVEKYFNFTEARSFTELSDRLPRKSLSIEKIMFLEWMLEEGLPYLQNDLLKNDLRDIPLLVDQIEYVKFILEEEMALSSPDNIHSCLVDIISFMPDRIENAYFIYDEHNIQIIYKKAAVSVYKSFESTHSIQINSHYEQIQFNDVIKYHSSSHVFHSSKFSDWSHLVQVIEKEPALLAGSLLVN